MALALGQRASGLGLETLDVAKIHERALTALKSPARTSSVIKQAGLFFAETIAPIEETHRAAIQTKARLAQLNKALGRRTVDLAASNRSLKQGVARRKGVEEAVKKSEAHFEALLKESHRLQKHLQQLAHRILLAQEDKRKKISQDLQNEIAQTLLGINVRLLTLKNEAALDAKSLQKEFANTQRLVDKSVESIKRFARAFGRNHEG